MTWFRCTTDKYDALYARYLENPGQLLDLAGWTAGQTLLDLCGGTGAVTKEALRRGADPDDIVLVDLNPRCSAEGVRQIQGDANHMTALLDRTPIKGPSTPRNLRDHFDVVVCRQAVMYLDLNEGWFRALSVYMRTGGRLAFNLSPWPEEAARWAYKRYRYGSSEYVEAVVTLFGRVYHLQASPGIGIDVTSFHCHREGHLTKSLDKAGFDVFVQREPRALRWVCRWSAP